MIVYNPVFLGGGGRGGCGLRAANAIMSFLLSN